MNHLTDRNANHLPAARLRMRMQERLNADVLIDCDMGARAGDASFFANRNVCPVCGSRQLVELYSSPFSEGPVRRYLESFYASQGNIEFGYLNGVNYVLTECRDCELVFQKLVPGRWVAERLYEKWIDPERQLRLYHTKIDVNYYLWLANQMQFVVRCFRVATPSELRVLDFGMGWGEWCRMALAHGFDTYGSELSGLRIENAKRMGVKTVEWDEMPGIGFDFVNAEQVFEHLADPLATLNHLKCSLKPNGILRISVPDGSDVRRRLERMNWEAPKGSAESLNLVSPLEHVNCFSNRSLQVLGERAGLQMVSFPLSFEYLTRLDWGTPKSICKNLFRPLLRRRLNRSTEIYFRSCS